MISEHFFNDRDTLFTALAEECGALLQAAVDARGRASMLVSGGSTPKPLYERLARTTLPWQAIAIALVDERWVSPGEAGSNETFVKQALLQGPASEARYIATKTAHTSASEGLASCEQAYRQLPRPFDLTILGMGPDGHTASLFPHAAGLEDAMDPASGQLCAAINAQASAVTGDLTERLSLSLYGLLQSRQLHLLITGDDKREIYEAAKLCTDIIATPVSAVLNQNEVPVHVYWAP